MAPQRRCGEIDGLLARAQPCDRIAFSRAAREQNDLARFEDGSNAHGDRVRWYRLIEKKCGVGFARGLAQRDDVRSRFEWRSGLIERDVTIRSEAEKCQSETAGAFDGALVTFAFDFEMGRTAVRDVRILRINIDAPEQVLLHEAEVTSGMVARNADVLVEIERHDVAEAAVLERALRHEALGHTDRRVSSRQAEDE